MMNTTTGTGTVSDHLFATVRRSKMLHVLLAAATLCTLFTQGQQAATGLGDARLLQAKDARLLQAKRTEQQIWSPADCSARICSHHGGERPAQRRRAGADHRAFRSALFDRLDADGSGEVSTAELDRAMEQLLADDQLADRNRDAHASGARSGEQTLQ